MAFPVATRSTGFFITSSVWNADLADNLNTLRGGGIAISGQGANQVPYASSATQLASSALFQFNGTTLALSGLGNHTFIASGSGAMQVTVGNASAGTANYAVVNLGNDATSSAGELLVTSTTFTPSDPVPSDGVMLRCERGGGITVAATHVSGALRFFTGGNTKRWEIAADGTLQSSGAHDLAFGGDAVIRRTTSDGSDTGFIAVTGGGSPVSTERAAIISLFGNEHANTGQARYRVGNVTGAEHRFYRSDGEQALTISGATGAITLASTAASAWTLNSTHASGGLIEMQRSGVATGRIGQTVGGGDEDDMGMYAVANLQFRADDAIQFKIASDTTMAYMLAETFYWRHDNVEHGMTDIVPTDVYGAETVLNSSDGGYAIAGFTEAASAMEVRGYATSENTATSTGALAPVQTNAFLKSSADKTSLGGTANIFVVMNNGATQFIVKGGGAIHSNDSHNTFDKYDDWKLALAYEATLSPSQKVQALFQKFCRYNAQTLEDADLLSPAAQDGSRMMNVTGLLKLALGAAWQLGIGQEQLRASLAKMRREVRQLRAAEA